MICSFNHKERRNEVVIIVWGRDDETKTYNCSAAYRLALLPSLLSSFPFSPPHLIANGRVVRLRGIATRALTYAGGIGSVRGDDPRRCGGLLWGAWKQRMNKRRGKDKVYIIWKGEGRVGRKGTRSGDGDDLLLGSLETRDDQMGRRIDIMYIIRTGEERAGRMNTGKPH